MADVFLAYDRVLDRDVALKLLKDRYAGDEDFVERFRREAKSAAALSSPFIVPVFDRGETEDGAYYIALEYLPGGTLEGRLPGRRRAAAPASPSIVPVFDRGETEDGAYDIAMEYLPGGTLEDRLARAGRLPSRE